MFGCWDRHLYIPGSRSTIELRQPPNVARDQPASKDESENQVTAASLTPEPTSLLYTMETSLLGQEEEGRTCEILDLTGKTVTSSSGAIAAGHGALGSNLSTARPSPACHFYIA